MLKRKSGSIYDMMFSNSQKHQVAIDIPRMRKDAYNPSNMLR